MILITQFSVFSQDENEMSKTTYIFPVLDAPFNTNFGSIKSRGFMVGNIYLERAYELRLGLNLVF